MKRTDRNNCQHTKPEIVKPQRTVYSFACQTLALSRTLGLTIALTGLLTIKTFGQIPTVQTPTFQNFQQVPQPWTPNPNNNLIPNFNPTIPTNTGIDQHKKDQQNQQNRQQQLQKIYYEINKPSSGMTNVRYDLPPCSSVSGASAYQTAFSELSKMASGEKTFSVKEANFIVENAYYENQGKYESFDKVIGQITQFLNWKMDELGYNKNSNLSKNLILYQFFADTLEIKSKNLRHLPFKYDFNHMYIKLQNKANGWYNTELTSGVFPIDAWLMASGYIHLDAIVNKLYMEALNEKQTTALCMTDLAKGYERKHGDTADLDFVLKCCDATLKHYPNYINALLLKAETKKKKFDQLMAKRNTKNPQDILTLPESKHIFTEMTAEYSKIHDLGYRAMPENMYMDWLLLLKKNGTNMKTKKLSILNP